MLYLGNANNDDATIQIKIVGTYAVKYSDHLISDGDFILSE
jgi:hypothetical protein